MWQKVKKNWDTPAFFPEIIIFENKILSNAPILVSEYFTYEKIDFGTIFFLFETHSYFTVCIKTEIIL